MPRPSVSSIHRTSSAPAGKTSSADPSNDWFERSVRPLTGAGSRSAIAACASPRYPIGGTGGDPDDASASPTADSHPPDHLSLRWETWPLDKSSWSWGESGTAPNGHTSVIHKSTHHELVPKPRQRAVRQSAWLVPLPKLQSPPACA